MMPWKLIASSRGYIFTWLIAYSALLGPIGGILIADYFVWRRRDLNLDALYAEQGEYRFTRGFSIVAMIALVLGVLPSLPGFLVEVKAIDRAALPESWVSIYHYAWFVGFAVAFVTYLAGRYLARSDVTPRPELGETPTAVISL
jgi:NCS1 family nucleobase:cation symporter-1